MPIDSIYDFSDKALVEIKSWLEPWFLTRDVDTAGGGGGNGLQYNVGTYGPDNEGDWVDIGITGQDAAGYGMRVHGAVANTGINGLVGVIADGVDGFTQAENAVVNTTGTGDAQGYEATADCHGTAGSAACFIGDATARGNGAASLLTGTVGNNGSAANSSGGSYGVSVTAKQGLGSSAHVASGEAVAADLTAQGLATSTGQIIGLRVQCVQAGSGAVHQVVVLDHSGNQIFRVDDNGSVHIKTGTSIVADL